MRLLSCGSYRNQTFANLKISGAHLRLVSAGFSEVNESSSADRELQNQLGRELHVWRQYAVSGFREGGDLKV